MLTELAANIVPNRPNRLDPRAIKREKKHYSALKIPRAVMATGCARRCFLRKRYSLRSEYAGRDMSGGLCRLGVFLFGRLLFVGQDAFEQTPQRALSLGLVLRRGHDRLQPPRFTDML